MKDDYARFSISSPTPVYEPENYLMTAPEAAKYLGRSMSSLQIQRDEAKRRGIPPLIPFVQEGPGKPVFYWKGDLDKVKSGEIKRRPTGYSKKYLSPVEAAEMLHIPVSALAKDRTRASEVIPYTHFAKSGPAYRAMVIDAILADPLKLWAVQQKLVGTRK